MWDARKSLVVGWRSQTRPSRTSWNGCLACISLGAHRPGAARAGWKMRTGHRSLVSSDRTAAAMLETRHSERQKFSNGINERTERESSEWASKFNASSSDFDSTIRSLDPSRLSQEGIAVAVCTLGCAPVREKRFPNGGLNDVADQRLEPPTPRMHRSANAEAPS